MLICNILNPDILAWSLRSLGESLLVAQMNSSQLLQIAFNRDPCWTPDLIFFASSVVLRLCWLYDVNCSCFPDSFSVNYFYAHCLEVQIITSISLQVNMNKRSYRADWVLELVAGEGREWPLFSQDIWELTQFKELLPHPITLFATLFPPKNRIC